MKKLAKLAICSASLLAFAGPANASTLIFIDRAAFDAATGGGLAFESFEQGFEASPSLTFPGLTVSETGRIEQVFNDGDGATDGDLAVNIQDNGDSLFTFTFLAPINSFGGDFTSFEDAAVVFSGGANGAFALTAFTPQFFGFVSDTPFTTVSFNASGDPVFGVDALSFGTAVPEPATWAMLLLGFFGIGGALRSVRRSQVALTYS